MQLRIGLLFTGKWFTGIVEVLEIKRSTNELEVKCRNSDHSSSDWWFETWDLGVTERGFGTRDYFISSELEKQNDLNDPIMKPSLFLERPWSSIRGKSEYETVAHNIMAILSRTGDKFRELSWDEYEMERRKDRDFHEMEREYFNEMRYLENESVKHITNFCAAWKGSYVKEKGRLEKTEA